MTQKLEEEISRMHKDIEDVKETLSIIVEDYVEMMHELFDKDRNSFISLEDYKKKYDLRH